MHSNRAESKMTGTKIALKAKCEIKKRAQMTMLSIFIVLFFRVSYPITTIIEIEFGQNIFLKPINPRRVGSPHTQFHAKKFKGQKSFMALN
ncbi:MAG: hypothetical protein DRR00_04480 [Candidatus Parabeggiatoa sp. nov. 3]|nr:MAG: hypothetical protein DRR00_04480 [Gammaproteobacteria bacterium]RKZ68909.1 MAG: hypothetical protein DRQ99_02345 [Gammaproteobacteria bacterium]